MLICLLFWGLIIGPLPEPTPQPAPPPTSPPAGLYLPPFSLPPTVIPVPTPQLPEASTRVDCLQWDYPQEDDALIAKFIIQVAGDRLPGDEFGIPNVPTPAREVPIERLLLYRDGRYDAQILAVTAKNERSEPSDPLCLQVINRQVYSCHGEAVPKGCGSSKPAGL